MKENIELKSDEVNFIPAINIIQRKKKKKKLKQPPEELSAIIKISAIKINSNL